MAMIIDQQFLFNQMQQENSPSQHNPQNGNPQAIKNDIKEGLAHTLFQAIADPLQQDSWIRSSLISQKNVSEIIRLDGIQQYSVDPNLLLGTSISQLQRAKLRSQLSKESAKRDVSRRTTATANMLIDLFFTNGGSVSLEQYHALGIACLLLANKLNQNITILVDHSVFPLAELNQIQINLCLRLQFRLNPITYIHAMDQILIAWNYFASRYSDSWGYKISDLKDIDTQMRILSCRKYYELLDSLYLNTRAYVFPSVCVVLEVFRILLQMDYQIIKSLPISIEDEVIITFWQQSQESKLLSEQFSTIFEEYMKFIGLSSSMYEGSKEELQNYVGSFIENGFKESYRDNHDYSNQSYYQTYNKTGYSIIKKATNLNTKFTNVRKSSDETTI